MSRRRRGRSIADDDDDETPDSGPGQGYRAAPERPLAAPPPEGELLEATPADRRALDGQRAQARNRLVGMGVGAAILLRIALPLGQSLFPGFTLLPVLLVLAAVVLIGYALWAYLVPRGIGPAIVRVEPTDEIRAGRFLTITLLLQPPNELELDLVKVQLVARKASDRGQEPEVIHFSEGILAARLTIEANQAVRLQTTLLVSEDAPLTSRKRGIAWRVEVSFGAPSVYSHRVPIRVLPLEKRLQERAERRRRAALP